MQVSTKSAPARNLRTSKRTNLVLIAALVFLAVCIAFALRRPPTDLQPISVKPAQSEGFCSNGVFPSTTAPSGRSASIPRWGSYCNGGDQNTGSFSTSPFRASRALRLYLAGYPSHAGVNLQIEKISDGSQFEIRPSRDPNQHWTLFEFALPASWQGAAVRLVARDQSTESGGWVAFSEPIRTNDSGFRSAAVLFLMTALYCVLILLPAFAVCGCVVYKGIRTTLTAGLVLLATIGASGYVSFWSYFLSRRLGHAVAIALPVAALLLIIWITPKLDFDARKIVQSLIPPVALCGAATLLVLSSGFLYGGMNDPFETAAERFSHRLPNDNTLPFLLAEALRDGHIVTPMSGTWLSSDRPPLQTGIVLSQYPFAVRPRDRSYTVISAFAQSLWIFGLWLLLTACSIRRKLIALVLATCLFSGFAFINGFFVWPKLLAAAFTLGLFAVLFGDRVVLGRGEQIVRFVAGGALLAFAMLSHGGTIFAIIGAAAAIIVFRKWLPLKRLALLVAVSAAIYFPWMLYQKFVDPPGDRLVKMHLAGVMGIDPRPVPQVILSAFENLTLQQWLQNKRFNLDQIVGHGAEYWGSVGAITKDLLTGSHGGAVLQTAANARAMMFFFFVPCLAFVSLGFLALVAGLKKQFRTKEWRTAAVLLPVIVFSLANWCLLMFIPGLTVNHAGAYAVNLLAFAAGMLALWALSPRLAVIIGVLQIGINVLLYVALMRGFAPGGPLPVGYLRSGMLLLCLAALGIVLYLVFLIGKQRSEVTF